MNQQEIVLEERITQLELKVAFQDTIEQLNKAFVVTTATSATLDNCESTEKLKKISDKPDQPSHFSPDTERPPHLMAYLSWDINSCPS